jgi:hypothetical protein
VPHTHTSELASGAPNTAARREAQHQWAQEAKSWARVHGGYKFMEACVFYDIVVIYKKYIIVRDASEPGGTAA